MKKETIIKEQLISLSTAKLAEEKGFPQENYYLTKAQIEFLGPRIVSQTLLQRWIRETHKIYITVEFDFMNFNKYNYNFYITDITSKKSSLRFERVNGFILFKNGFRSYEKALEIGLQKALKLISNENKKE